MITLIDVHSIGLLLISLGVFLVRYVRQDPPIQPYVVIALVCALGNWLGDRGAELAAVVLLTAASFLFLACLLQPLRSEWRRKRARRDHGGAGALKLR